MPPKKTAAKAAGKVGKVAKKPAAAAPRKPVAAKPKDPKAPKDPNALIWRLLGFLRLHFASHPIAVVHRFFLKLYAANNVSSVEDLARLDFKTLAEALRSKQHSEYKDDDSKAACNATIQITDGAVFGLLQAAKDVVQKTAAAKLSMAGYPNGLPWSQLSKEEQDERKKASDGLAYTRNQKWRTAAHETTEDDFYDCIKAIIGEMRDNFLIGVEEEEEQEENDE